MSIKFNIQPIEQIEGFDYMEGHYFSHKTKKLVGFPHPDGHTKGIWRWKKVEGTLVLKPVEVTNR